MEYIGYVYSDFQTKFGIPRQAGVVESLKAKIVFKPEYSHPDAFRRIEEFSHIWILWEFSEAKQNGYSLTVRPPRLGGNTRVGVFASRSPFRPNSIGLSCVKLDRVEYSENEGTVLHISGADIMNGTPVFDIKPYLPYSDCHIDATGGYTDDIEDVDLDVKFECDVPSQIDDNILTSIIDILKKDPRPSYQNDPDRIYGLDYAGFNIKFKVYNNKLTLTKIKKI